MSEDRLHQATARRVLKALDRSRRPVAEALLPSSPGIYGVFTGEPYDLGALVAAPGSPLYIGISNNLQSRDIKQHFQSGKTGSSTLRRTLGALLKTRLGLKAVPRGKSSAPRIPRNARHRSKYRFDDGGEDRLTKWMLALLELGFWQTPEPKAIERHVVAAGKPPLNLTFWPNPHRAQIKRLRRLCADHAYANP